MSKEPLVSSSTIIRRYKGNTSGHRESEPEIATEIGLKLVCENMSSETAGRPRLHEVWAYRDKTANVSLVWSYNASTYTAGFPRGIRP